MPQTVDARYFFAVITWGGLIHLAASYWTIALIDWYEDGALIDQHGVYALIWGIVTLVLGPLLAGILGAALVKRKSANWLLKFIAMDYVSRTPSAWNYATKLGPRWVRIHLKDGTIVAGSYGPGAFADDTDERDIYLEWVYNLDEKGDFTVKVANTAGVWINQDEISHVMFYFPSDTKEANND